jgi:hypothetical protein
MKNSAIVKFLSLLKLWLSCFQENVNLCKVKKTRTLAYFIYPAIVYAWSKSVVTQNLTCGWSSLHRFAIEYAWSKSPWWHRILIFLSFKWYKVPTTLLEKFIHTEIIFVHCYTFFLIITCSFCVFCWTKGNTFMIIFPKISAKNNLHLHDISSLREKKTHNNNKTLFGILIL